MTTAQTLWTRLSNGIKWLLAPDTVVLSAPPNFKRLIPRCRLTILLAASVIVRIMLLSTGSEVDLAAVVVFAGALEYFSGTAAVAWCFCVPLASGALVHWIFQSWPEGLEFMLGACGCFGGLLWFLKQRWVLLGVVLAFAGSALFIFEDFRGVSFVVALLSGLGIMKAYLTLRDLYR